MPFYSRFLPHADAPTDAHVSHVFFIIPVRYAYPETTVVREGAPVSLMPLNRVAIIALCGLHH
jgi:hypothetical protein